MTGKENTAWQLRSVSRPWANPSPKPISVSWFKQQGEAVKADEPLVELETDKVTIEVPAPADGVLTEITAREGETVGVDALLASLSEDGAGAAPAAAPAQPAASAAAKPASAASADAGELVDVVVPSGGESVTEADVGEWFKKKGDAVAVDEALVELETDKAAQEVMSKHAGVVAEIVAETGTTVEVGAVLARIRTGANAQAKAEPVPTEPEIPPQPAADPQPASPAANRLNAGKQDCRRQYQRLRQTRPDPERGRIGGHRQDRRHTATVARGQGAGHTGAGWPVKAMMRARNGCG